MNKKTILITGCSTGVGRDLAVRLAQAGHQVIATARNPDSLKELPVACRLALDVTDQLSVDRAIEAAVAACGPIDVLVSNAGYAIRAAVEEIDDALAKAMFEVNVWGALRVCKAVLPAMRVRGQGRIVHVGSVVGRFSFPLNGAYAASKHALEALADSMRVELQGFGIPVVLIEPGTINTHFMASSKSIGAIISGNTDSPYAALYREFDLIAAEPAFRGAPAGQVSRIIQKAVEARRPKSRYLAAVSPLYLLVLSLGDGGRDFLARRAFRIRKK